MTETAIETTLTKTQSASGAVRPAPLDWLLSFRGLDLGRMECGGFDSAAEWIREGLEADNVYLVSADGNADGFACLGSAHAEPAEDSPLTASQAILATAIGSGHSLLVDRGGQNTPFAADPQLQRFNIVSALCVPMTLSGRCLGAIYADARSAHAWNEGDLAVVELAANLLALALDHGRLQTQARDNLAMAEAGLAAQKMSHAVKNILQMVCGAGEVIEFALKNKHLDRLQRSWDILQPNLQRMKKFTLDMLDYSRPRPFEFAPADPAALITTAAGSFATIFSARNIRPELKLDSAPKSVTLDAARVNEMLNNLILFSLDRIGNQPGWIRIECRTNPTNSSVEIHISDSGPALKADEDLFSPYEPSRDQLSTGLGMAIAKRIAETHKGTIGFDPAEKAVRITLPI